MLPKEAFHVTFLFDVVPCTVAANGTVPRVIEDAVPGDTVTELTVVFAGAGVTVTVADADFVESALLAAVTVAVPGLDGAV
jgi:hypothetical protein